ncbi:MAG: thioredoxin [Lachnospiraceae bacterium]|nr:thioredoxin [Lachnospiraceae bacterium]
MIVSISKDNFEDEVLNSQHIVLVDFYADWCGPCKMMYPIIRQLSLKYTGDYKMTTCDIDKQIELAQRYGVLSIPTIIIFYGGKIIETFIGSMSIYELDDALSEIMEKLL